MRILLSLSLAAAAAVCAGAAEVSVSWGAGPKNQTEVRTPAGSVLAADSSGTVLLDASGKLLGIGPVSLNWDIPVGFGGPGYANVVAQSGSAAAYAEKMKWVVTPGLKLKLGLGLFSPWVSFGAGGARLDRSGVLSSLGAVDRAEAANGWSLALSPAGGIDFKPIPVLFFRGEVRSYSLRPAESIFSSSNLLQSVNWRNNVLFMVGVGARF